jgi:hypothetical protein
VSTLTPAQLDTPNPPIILPPVITDVTAVNVATKSTGSPIVTPPVRGGSAVNASLSVDAAFTQLSTKPTLQTVIESKLDEDVSASIAPVSARAIDLAFASLA